MKPSFEEVERLYNIKCSKYKERELTPDFRNDLFRETIEEVFQMHIVSESACK